MAPGEPRGMTETVMSGHGAAGATIAALVRTEILSGAYAPGERIRQEDLAARHRTSRVPVREALRILEAEGMVTRVANAGAWVSRLSLGECEELYRVRERLEPLLLSLTMPLLDDAVADELDALAAAMRTASPEEFLLLDRRFHFATYDRASTVMLQDTVEGLWNRTQHYRRAFVIAAHARRDGSAHDDHRLLAGAVRRGDSEEAESILARHIRRTRLELAHHPEIFQD